MSRGRVKGNDAPRADLSTMPKGAAVDVQIAYTIDVFSKMADLAKRQGDFVAAEGWEEKIKKLKNGTLFKYPTCGNCGTCIDCKY